MDYRSMVGESFEYAKEAVVGKWYTWLMLIIATILLGIPLAGYILNVLRGEKPAPEVNDWKTLFIEGIRYLIIMFIYMIPAMIVLVVVVGVSTFGTISANPTAAMAATGSVLFGMLLFVVIALVTSIFAIIGAVRFARTGNMREAFNFRAILAAINRLGWGPYIIALVILAIIEIIIGFFVTILTMIPIIGFLIYLCLLAPIALLFARYVCLLYDSAGAV
jgi:hypothetical protein